MASKGINNHFVINIYTIGEAGFVTWFLLTFLPGFKFKRVLTVALPILLVVMQVVLFFINGWRVFSFASYLVYQLFLIVLTSIVFLFFYFKHSEGNIFSFSYFWIVSGLLMYYSLSTIVFSALELGLTPKYAQLFQIFDYFHPVLYIFVNLMFAKAYLCKKELTI